MNIDLNKKSDIGHLRLESPTSDIEEERIPDEVDRSDLTGGTRRPVRVVPLRDLARYAGRLIRASVAEGSDLLVTDRGHPLVLIAPLAEAAPPPRYVWTNDGLVQKPNDPVVPEHLTGDERAVAEVLAERPSSIDGICRALGWAVGRTSIALVRLELDRAAHRVGATWRLRC